MARLRLAPYQAAAIFNPFTHFAMIGGIGAGKTHTGAAFAIIMLKLHPRLRGFIGANTYDQMSQATLLALYSAFHENGIEYVQDKIPPGSWAQPKLFDSYKNIISVRQRLADGTFAVTYIFKRVLSEPDSLRGIEFSWYWIDESRDTPLYTHQVILGRMRESEIMRGLVTTTSNGRDWVWDKFVNPANAPRGQTMFGCLHVKTQEAVKCGFISDAYYQMLRRSYSPMLARQELDAEHVNPTGARAYYASGDHNRQRLSPWGTSHPTPDRPLIIGCDFNFQPAPCVWMVGQIGNDQQGRARLHWFDEISGVQMSTPDMTTRLIAQYSNFFLRFYGDASATRGNTSNHGQTDTIQIAQVCQEAGILYSMDFDQSNPRVKNRVENVNRLCMNGQGEVTMTYNPDRCPLLDGDLEVVGWKKMVAGKSVQGRLDDLGDEKRTHASDGAGYAAWKLFPLEQLMLAGGTVKRQFAGFEVTVAE